MDFEIALNAMEECVLIVDAQDKIIYFNKAYGEFIGYDLDDVKEMALTDIRPGAKMPEVLKTGETMEVVLREEKGQEYFANIYPIFKAGKLVGGISTITFLKNAKFIVDKLTELEKNKRT